jgi:hypothetical protein
VLYVSAIPTEDLQLGVSQGKTKMTVGLISKLHKKLKEVMKLDESKTPTFVDIEKNLEGLHRVCLPSGEILWLCAHHLQTQKP